MPAEDVAHQNVALNYGKKVGHECWFKPSNDNCLLIWRDMEMDLILHR